MRQLHHTIPPHHTCLATRSDRVPFVWLGQQRWVTTDYKAGDVVLFTMHTLHGGIRNETDHQLRLSADLRFQPSRELRDERWIGHPPPMHERSRGLSGAELRKLTGVGLDQARSMDDAIRDDWGLPAAAL